MIRIFIYLIVLLGSSTFFSCNIINPTEEIPTYIYIDSFEVQNIDPGVHGSVSDRITDAWVFVDNDIIGAFELPAKIPIILTKENTAINIGAGIWDNGISGSRVRYPFYNLSGHTIPLNPGGGTNITPLVSYKSEANFELVENFEQGNSFVNYLGSDTSIIQSSDPTYLFEGSQTGLVLLDRASGIVSSESITTQSVQVTSNAQSYIEFDYKCDVDIDLWAQVSATNAPVINGRIIQLRAREDWNKIYVNLTEFGTSYPGRDFNFIFKVALPAGTNEGYFAVDNFKVVSF